jgi:meso-butanediol dehydrogenase/(S,S)-butanediol dehydrogenase/diacetyl reductase
MGFDFAGKAVLVTGSTQGIGEATALAFAQAGAKVMLTGRNAEKGAAVQAAIAAAGGEADYVQADLCDAGVCDALIEQTVARFGALDVLVNNAGVFGAGNAIETSDESWRLIMTVNVDAVFYMSRAGVRQMLKQGGGAIVNNASEWGLKGEPGHVAYTTSKGAIIQLTRSMALDHATDNIRVNSVCPGEILTEILEGLIREGPGEFEDNMKVLANGVPMKRLAATDEVAQCILFLASGAASYVTGTNFSVDGGENATGGPYPV